MSYIITFTLTKVSNTFNMFRPQVYYIYTYVYTYMYTHTRG